MGGIGTLSRDGILVRVLGATAAGMKSLFCSECSSNAATISFRSECVFQKFRLSFNFQIRANFFNSSIVITAVIGSLVAGKHCSLIKNFRSDSKSRRRFNSSSATALVVRLCCTDINTYKKSTVYRSLNGFENVLVLKKVVNELVTPLFSATTGVRINRNG